MKKIPDNFKSILWSYDFSLCDPIKMKNTIITNAISYGNLDHWRWIKSFYGVGAVKKVLNTMPNLTIRPSALRLANLMF
ncbi:MAG: hypothetical protein NT161_00125 [Candidatus Nomurabacteria bacterium]|nr:hypothetical protein [Candidatus Nomurabacteria bacterium]